MQAYKDLLRDVLMNGTKKEDRTGTGTRSVFGRQIRFDLRQGFPAVTTKKLFWKGVVGELLWFLSGSTNVKDLQAMGVKIWDEWAREDGSLGPIYSEQWRKMQVLEPDYTLGETEKDHVGITRKRTIDQIAEVIHSIKTNPDSRRHIVSAWNVSELHKMALEPCHVLFQFYVTPGHQCGVCNGKGYYRPCPIDGVGDRGGTCEVCKGTGQIRAKLSCQLYQRSADLFLGVPFNIASYALLTHMIAQVCDLDVGEFIHTFGDAHIYENHLEQVQLQLTREPLPLPKLWLNPEVKDIDGFSMEDCLLEGYSHHPAITAPVAV